MKQIDFNDYVIVTSGSTYIDIDAYACCVATTELLQLKGIKAIAYSCAPYNYSVLDSFILDTQVNHFLPDNCNLENTKYIIVDISEPKYLSEFVSLENVIEVYDHHVGFEEYWINRIGENAHIEFIGAAATLIYREWKNAGMLDKMKSSTAKLMIAAILDNTLNLTSTVTTDEDIETFHALCERENLGREWCVSYFSKVQECIELNLKHALFNDIKTIQDNDFLPSKFGQICIWNTTSVLNRIEEIRQWFNSAYKEWMLNLIDIKDNCSYFICDNYLYQKEMSNLFKITFDNGIAKTAKPYLRKEIIKLIKSKEKGE